MDANGSRFFSIATPSDWRLETRERRGVHCCRRSGIVRLAGAPLLAEDRTRALERARTPSAAMDADGVLYAWVADPAGGRIVASIDGRIDADLVTSNQLGGAPVDAAIDEDGVLHLATADGAVAMVDTRGRWAGPRFVSAAGLAAGRLAPRRGGGVWILDIVSGRVGVLTGRPLRDGFRAVDPAAFQREEFALAPPRIRSAARDPLPDGWLPIGLAEREGRLAILALASDATQPAAVFGLDRSGLFLSFRTEGLASPYDIAWLDGDSVALLAIGAETATPQQVLVFDMLRRPARRRGSVSTAPLAPPAKVLLARLKAERSGFVNAPLDTPHYVVAAASGLSAHPVRALSAAVLCGEGSVGLGPFDAGSAGSVWHRLRLEASIPAACLVLAELHASDSPDPPDDNAVWSPHVFGSPDAARHGGAALAPAFSPEAPRAAWLDLPSELPQHQGRPAAVREPGRNGLFSVLVQRAGLATRSLRGRYLRIRLKLAGDTRATPALRAFRVYAERFSYRDRYLPALYGEELNGDAGDATSSATGSDFLGRFLALFEEPLTIIEDQVAHAHLLTDPASAPAAALPWLGNWIGVEPEEGGGAARLRERLRAAPHTARLSGTLAGLMAALEIETGGRVLTGIEQRRDAVDARLGKPALADIDGVAAEVLVLAPPDALTGRQGVVLSGGGVTSGRIVVVEGYRLRRTAATILGADLSGADDPLTAGGGQSGNSIVGDTLVLGREGEREFLALFGGKALLSSSDRAAAARFLDRLAFSVLVLVRREAEPSDRRRLASQARRHAPAYVDVVVQDASEGLIIGLASIVGVDGFLAARRQPGPFRQGRSRLGGGDQTGGGFLEGMASAPPPLLPVRIEGRRGLSEDFIWDWR